MAGGSEGVPVIYAIEEPETSQHPDHQERIINAFREVAEGGDQVLLTTHTPALAGLLPVDCLRFVDSDPSSGAPRVRSGSPDVFAEVADILGVLPEAAHQEAVRVAVAVEGPTDVDALISLAHVLVQSGDLVGFDQSRVFWTLGGGSTLKDWLERRYLDSLKIPQIYIFDSDQTSSAIPPPKDKIDQLNNINGRPNCHAFLTRKRTIENYADANAIARISAGKITLSTSVNADYGNIEEAFKAALNAAKSAHGQMLGFHPDDHNGNAIPLSKTKKIITSFIMRHMTADEIRARSSYQDNSGGERNEVIDWLNAIRQHL